MKKIIASLLILTQLCLIAGPMTSVPIASSQAQQQVVMGTNAYEDAEKLTEMDKILREVAERNEKASELNLESYHDSTKGVATGVGSAAVDFGLGMGINGVTKNIGKGKQNVIKIHDKLINTKRNTKLALYGIDKSPFLIKIKLIKNARIATNFILPKYAPLILEIFFLKTQSDTYLVIIY